MNVVIPGDGLLYHITAMNRIKSIFKNGLKVNTGICGMIMPKLFPTEYQNRYGEQPIFLTSNPVDVLTYHMVINKYGYNIVILAIDALELELEYEAAFSGYDLNDTDKKMFICRSDIGVDKIPPYVHVPKKTYVDAMISFKKTCAYKNHTFENGDVMKIIDWKNSSEPPKLGVDVYSIEGV